MKKNLKILKLKNDLKKKINQLDKNKIHIFYFKYYLNWHNFYKNPLLITTKLLSKWNGDKDIDHVGHISNFIPNGDGYLANIFEASVKRGMEENGLFDKVKKIQGEVYVETINKDINFEKHDEFKKRYFAVPYSKRLAAMSGIDWNLIDSVNKPKSSGGFCSWLTALYLLDQGVDINHIENGNPLEITPADLYHGNLGNKSILFKY